MEPEEKPTENQEKQETTQENIETKKPFNGWKMIVIILLIIIAIFGMVKIAECAQTNNQNNDGATHLTSRSAKNSDISIDTDMDWSSLGTKIVITPNVDIDDLKITVTIQDKNKSALYTTQKFIGDVKKSVQTSCSVTLSELGYKNSLNAKYVSVKVSGGTVSYFSK